MKLPRLTLSRNISAPRNPVGLVRFVAWSAVILWAGWLGWLLFNTVASDLLAPRPIDPTQISAGQEKVNRKLLDTVNTRDAQKKETAITPILKRNPFGE